MGFQAVFSQKCIKIQNNKDICDITFNSSKYKLYFSFLAMEVMKLFQRSRRVKNNIFLMAMCTCSVLINF